MRLGKSILTTVLAVVALSATAEAQSVSDSDFISMESVTLPLNKDTSFSMLISLNNKTPGMALSVPLTFAGNPILSPNLSIDTTVFDAVNNTRGITQQTLGNSGFWAVRSSKVDNVNKTILIGYVSFGSPLPPSNGRLTSFPWRPCFSWAS